MKLFYGLNPLDFINCIKCDKTASLDIDSIESSKWTLDNKEVIFFTYETGRKDNNYRYYFEYNDNWYYTQYNRSSIWTDTFATKGNKKILYKQLPSIIG